MTANYGSPIGEPNKLPFFPRRITAVGDCGACGQTLLHLTVDASERYEATLCVDCDGLDSADDAYGIM